MTGWVKKTVEGVTRGGEKTRIKQVTAKKYDSKGCGVRKKGGRREKNDGACDAAADKFDRNGSSPSRRQKS